MTQAATRGTVAGVCLGCNTHGYAEAGLFWKTRPSLYAVRRSPLIGYDRAHHMRQFRMV